MLGLLFKNCFQFSPWVRSTKYITLCRAPCTGKEAKNTFLPYRAVSLVTGRSVLLGGKRGSDSSRQSPSSSRILLCSLPGPQEEWANGASDQPQTLKQWVDTLHWKAWPFSGICWGREKVDLRICTKLHYLHTHSHIISEWFCVPNAKSLYILWESMCLFSIPLHYGVFP